MRISHLATPAAAAIAAIALGLAVSLTTTNRRLSSCESDYSACCADLRAVRESLAAAEADADSLRLRILEIADTQRGPLPSEIEALRAASRAVVRKLARRRMCPGR